MPETLIQTPIRSVTPTADDQDDECPVAAKQTSPRPTGFAQNQLAQTPDAKKVLDASGDYSNESPEPFASLDQRENIKE